MSNIAEVKGQTIKITLTDGIPRTIKYTLNALAELEDRYGSVEAAFDKLEKENSMKALRCILWVGFLHESPELTEMEVGNLIDVAYMQDLVSSLHEALDRDLGNVEEDTVVRATVVDASGNSDPNA